MINYLAKTENIFCHTSLLFEEPPYIFCNLSRCLIHHDHANSDIKSFFFNFPFFEKQNHAPAFVVTYRNPSISGGNAPHHHKICGQRLDQFTASLLLNSTQCDAHFYSLLSSLHPPTRPKHSAAGIERNKNQL
jgi:hypothetical protein